MIKGLAELFSCENRTGDVSSIGMSKLNCFHVFVELLSDCLKGFCFVVSETAVKV